MLIWSHCGGLGGLGSVQNNQTRDSSMRVGGFLDPLRLIQVLIANKKCHYNQSRSSGFQGLLLERVSSWPVWRWVCFFVLHCGLLVGKKRTEASLRFESKYVKCVSECLAQALPPPLHPAAVGAAASADPCSGWPSCFPVEVPCFGSLLEYKKISNLAFSQLKHVLQKHTSSGT